MSHNQSIPSNEVAAMTFPRPAQVLSDHVNIFVRQVEQTANNSEYLKTPPISAKMSKNKPDTTADAQSNRSRQNQA